ncbi:ABC transporter permease subunit [Halorubrum californiense]|nr:ABC transporter permease subunit [Halorubrum californiense]
MLPIIALFLAKGAITGERQSGSIRLLLSLPPSRRDILFGKLIGRMSLMLVAALVGGVATAVAVVTLLGGGLGLLVPFIGFLCLMSISFVAVGVGISAASANDQRASAYAVGLYMVLVALWSLIYAGLQAGASWLGLAKTASQPVWLQFLAIFPPHRAATAAFEAVADGGSVLAADPFASAWLPTLVLLAWFVVPVAGGYLRFQNAEIE